jgi:hypothetical protein
MKELNEIVSQKITEMVKSGAIDKVIEDRIEKTISESIESCLKTYSDFGKSITEKIKDSLQCSGRDIEFPAYNIFISQIIQDKFKSVLESTSIKHLEQLVEKAIDPVTKVSKTSVLIDQIREEWADLARESGDDSIKIESSYNDDETALYVKITGPEHEGETVVTFYNFKNNEDNLWHIGYINTNGHRLTGRSVMRAGTYTNAVEDILFKYYAMGTKFELDEDFEDIDCGYY